MAFTISAIHFLLIMGSFFLKNLGVPHAQNSLNVRACAPTVAKISVRKVPRCSSNIFMILSLIVLNIIGVTSKILRVIYDVTNLRILSSIKLAPEPEPDYPPRVLNIVLKRKDINDQTYLRGLSHYNILKISMTFLDSRMDLLLPVVPAQYYFPLLSVLNLLSNFTMAALMNPMLISIHIILQLCLASLGNLHVTCFYINRILYQHQRLPNACKLYTILDQIDYQIKDSTLSPKPNME